jgi:release factor glutamine methyltransferase
VRRLLAGAPVESARRRIATRLREAGNATPELDARNLVGAVVDLDLTGMIAAAGRSLSRMETVRLNDLVTRRLEGWPVARLIGAKEFWGLTLAVSEATLVPRPDTETVVEAALDVIGERRDAPLLIADLGTGSGAILLALIAELPNAYGIGTDIAVTALATAAANARRLGFSSRTAFAVGDYAAALGGNFDLIVSNPPYIASDLIDGLTPEVRDHDPRRALDGGEDGLAAYRALVPQAADRLLPGGALIVEVGYDQAEAVATLMELSKLHRIVARADLGGANRAVVGHKRPV